jgi:hypothetical protein
MRELKAFDRAAIANSLDQMEFRELARFDAGHTGGSFFVVPRGCWRRQNLIARTKELSVVTGAQILWSDFLAKHLDRWVSQRFAAAK